MKRIFKTRSFSRWLRKSGLSDALLLSAVEEMECGLMDADLGGHVVKKRIAPSGRGKRGSTRTLIGTNFKDRWFFMYGFEKNERGNITDRELSALQSVAKSLLALKDKQITAAIGDGALTEIHHDHKTKKPNS
jgi:hypothetical protein